MNACLRFSPRQGKSKAAQRLVFSRRWDSFGSRNQPPLRENVRLQRCPQTWPRAIRGRQPNHPRITLMDSTAMKPTLAEETSGRHELRTRSRFLVATPTKRPHRAHSAEPTEGIA